MAKIDCRVTVNFLRESKRMCEYYRHDCDNCPMSIMNNGYDRLCTVAIEQYPDRAVEIVQEWSDDHPVKTRIDDLKERFPNVSLDSEGIPCFSPSVLGYCGDCDRCRNWENSYTRNCWDEPLVGGATGKAVE
jgi:hypothetical protein